MMVRISFAALAMALLLQPAQAQTLVTQTTPSADVCVKNIDALGSNMGHKAETAPDGRPIFRFVLRQNGLDYEVTCDATTGVLGDVVPRNASH